MKNLFIIGTPLQLINALEAIHHFKLENNVLVLIYRSRESNKEQIEAILDLHKWSEIIEIPYRSTSSLIKYVQLVRHLQKHVYDYVFTAKLDVVSKIVLPNVKKEKVFILDDGTTTIPLYEKYIKLNKLNKYNFKELRFLFFGLKVKIKDKINIFTYFDLEATDSSEIVKNNLDYLRLTYINENDKESFVRDEEVIYFIGQPIGLLDINLYKQSVEAVIKKYNKKVIYIPHRGENTDNESIFSSIDKKYFEFLIIGMPIELYFLYNKIYPAHIISYYSTAVTTLGLLYEDCKSNYIQLPLDKINVEKYNDDHKYFYEWFDKNKILTFDDLNI